jgi:hypothetical protein
MTEFGREFHPPKLINMLGTAWKRCGHSDFIFYR